MSVHVVWSRYGLDEEVVGARQAVLVASTGVRDARAHGGDVGKAKKERAQARRDYGVARRSRALHYRDGVDDRPTLGHGSSRIARGLDHLWRLGT